jgi:hypothetical protein
VHGMLFCEHVIKFNSTITIFSRTKNHNLDHEDALNGKERIRNVREFHYVVYVFSML